MKLLALVNSPAFARSRTVSDINQAASLLGIRGLRTVALSLVVSSMCPEHESCRVLMANSLRRAVSCRLVAMELGYKDLDAAFATGLFSTAGSCRTRRIISSSPSRSPRAPRTTGCCANRRRVSCRTPCSARAWARSMPYRPRP